MGAFRTVCPFGVSTKRFSTIGYHPDLDVYGTYRKCGGISPSHYRIKDIECPFKKKKRKESWTQKLELEEYSRTYGYKNAALIKTKQEEYERGGPGQYDISESLYKTSQHNKYENVSFGTTKRFKTKITNNNPGPGTYGVPHRKLEARKKPLHQWTNVPPFEWDCFVDRFREKYRSWELPCNLYKASVDGSIEALLAKVVSKRAALQLSSEYKNITIVVIENNGYTIFLGGKEKKNVGDYEFVELAVTKSRSGLDKGLKSLFIK